MLHRWQSFESQEIKLHMLGLDASSTPRLWIACSPPRRLGSHLRHPGHQGVPPPVGAEPVNPIEKCRAGLSFLRNHTRHFEKRSWCTGWSCYIAVSASCKVGTTLVFGEAQPICFDLSAWRRRAGDLGMSMERRFD